MLFMLLVMGGFLALILLFTLWTIFSYLSAKKKSKGISNGGIGKQSFTVKYALISAWVMVGIFFTWGLLYILVSGHMDPTAIIGLFFLMLYAIFVFIGGFLISYSITALYVFFSPKYRSTIPKKKLLLQTLLSIIILTATLISAYTFASRQLLLREAKSSQTSQTRLEEIYTKAMEKGDFKILQQLSGNTQTPAQILEDIYIHYKGHFNDPVSSNLAKNRNTPNKILEELAKNHWSTIRISVAKNPNVTRDILLKLKSDKNDEVRKAAELAWSNKGFDKQSLEVGPKLTCEEEVYNFGEVVNTKTVKHTFILRNEGGTPLEISRVRPGCGCTSAEISTKKIAPSKEAELKTSFDLHGRKGKQKINIRVMSNDPEQPALTLSLEGMAVAEIEVVPRYVYFKDIAVNTTDTKTVEIISGIEKSFKITKIESDSPYYDVALKTIEEGKYYQLYVHLKPQLSQKQISDQIMIYTDNPNYEEIPIRVLANIVGLFTIRPEMIKLVPDVDFPMTRYVVIRSAENKPFEIKSVEVPTPSIQTEVIPIDENGYRIKVSNIKSVEKLDGKNLHITTNLEEREEILIPFKIISEEGEEEETIKDWKLLATAKPPEEEEPEGEEIASDEKISTREKIIKEGQGLLKTIRTAQRIYFVEKGKYTDKWEDINGNNPLANNKYFTTPPEITVFGEGRTSTFTATVKGSGEAEGVSASIDHTGTMEIMGLKKE